MSSTEVTKTAKKPTRFANWKENPAEIKVMDLTTLAWLAIILVDIIIVAFIVDWNVRVFPTVFLPVFMFAVTISLRLRLIDKPELLRNTFVTWILLFVFTIILSIIILIVYPPIIGLS
ncbi:MAG: hypothetical protein FK733_07590 [Asgard group archaeon]|nr:hypothetical protein [Asgard group archaeon]